MKTSKYIWILGLLLSICALFIQIKGILKDYTRMPLKQFIIGRWEIAQPIEKHYVFYELEFINQQRLLCHAIDTKGVKHNNLAFWYEFIGDNKIKLSARTIDEWILEKRGEQLVVHRVWTGDTITYNRAIAISWPFISVIIAVFGSQIFFIQKSSKHEIDIKAHDFDKTTKKTLSLLLSLSHNLIALLTVGLGIYLGLSLLSLPFWIQITLPWDSVVILEISIGILILGIKILGAYTGIPNNLILIMKKYNYYFGTLIIGISISGLAISLLRLVIFLCYGSYLSE